MYKRQVTSTVTVEGGADVTVSVKTASDVSKGKIFDCVKALKGVTVKAPVKIGDVIVENAAGTGVDIVATGKDVYKRQAHHLALYFSIRLFFAIGYACGTAEDKASDLTSACLLYTSRCV